MDRTYPQPYPVRAPVAAKGRLDTEGVRAVYARVAGFYDFGFGGMSTMARRRAVASVNALPGRDVLEVGVGTGLALRHYAPHKRITGIDLSPHMLARATARAERGGLRQVDQLLVMDAEATRFADASFDIAVAMFVASVVPDARRLLAEMKRVVRPGGHILFANHFEAQGGPRLLLERAMAPGSRALGWHSDFALADLLGPADRARAHRTPLPPFGVFTLLRLVNDTA